MSLMSLALHLLKIHIGLGRLLSTLRFQATRMSSTTEYTSTDAVNDSKSPQRRLSMLTATLETMHFDNLALRDLPVDPVVDNRQRQVRGACFSRVSPTPVKKPITVAFSSSAMALLGLPESELIKPEFAEFFSGNRVLPGAEPAAHCYCGHQFGSFAGQLGDGATMYLGEVINKHGERWELQLKGAGKTPFSRTADGRKVLRSSIREYLCSEAIFHLGVPTTRAGSCITSDSLVVRDIFYDGNPIQERCSIISRIAPSFIRFGSFQISKGPDRETGQEGPSAGRPQIVQTLADYVIRTFYPQIWAEYHVDDTSRMYVEFFKEVVKRTASLVAHWQCIGFCHGVLNTDNMSILGLTIDYGPYGFLDRYDPNYICNASDDSGRYSYSRQPQICKWNCVKLAEALQMFAPMDELQTCVDSFDAEFDQVYLEIMRKKLGLVNARLDTDSKLIESLLETMDKTGADFTNTFRCLSRISLPVSSTSRDDIDVISMGVVEVEDYLLDQCASLEELKSACAPLIDPRRMAMIMSLLQDNPHIIHQMGKLYHQIQAEQKRKETLEQLQKITQEEKTQQNRALWRVWIDEYVSRLRAELVDVDNVQLANETRKNVMNTTNPRVILRNYVAQNAIEAAEQGDFSEVVRLQALLEHPYDDITSLPVVDDTVVGTESAAGAEKRHNDPIAQSFSSSAGCSQTSYDMKPPTWATTLRVT